MKKPLAIDLFCGLGGWTDGLIAEGWDVIGFDIERHVYGDNRYPAQLVLQDVLTLHGSQFKDVDLIVASPPCQEYSYMSMPWSRAKALAADYRSGKRDVRKLTALFDACFRIQREACEAAGRHIPLVVENVRGAIPWVGRSRWNFGSFHLWGDVPALMPMAKAIKNDGGSWFNIGSPGQKLTNVNPVHQLSAHKHDGSGRRENGTLVSNNRMVTNGRKVGKDWFGGYGGGFGWDSSPMRRNSSKSSKRKMASAMIAKIPLPLSRHIAATFRPMDQR
jgi:hypothetical protein